MEYQHQLSDDIWMSFPTFMQERLVHVRSGEVHIRYGNREIIINPTDGYCRKPGNNIRRRVRLAKIKECLIANTPFGLLEYPDDETQVTINGSIVKEDAQLWHVDLLGQKSPVIVVKRLHSCKYSGNGPQPSCTMNINVSKKEYIIFFHFSEKSMYYEFPRDESGMVCTIDKAFRDGKLFNDKMESTIIGNQVSA